MATRRSPGAVSRGTPTISELAVWPSIIRIYLALVTTRTVGTVRSAVTRHTESPAISEIARVAGEFDRTHAMPRHAPRRAWQRRFYTETAGMIWRLRGCFALVSGGYPGCASRRGDERVREPAPGLDEVAGLDHRRAGRGDRRVCHLMTWRGSLWALFAPTLRIKPRCVPANDADLVCNSGIVLRRLSGVRASLQRGDPCRYTHVMAYCIGRASLGRRMT